MRGENKDRTLAEKNMTVLRYGDVLLMRAEALIELNKDLPEAVSLINQIRARVNMPAVEVASQSVLREKLRHERRIETAFEGLRYYDLRTWMVADKEANGLRYGLNLLATDYESSWVRTSKICQPIVFERKHHLFPIAQTQLNEMKNFTQNEGWN